ncbi:hypothetical protein [Marinigracilibium pacificum]|uniref:Uncharacterized protein n=1 Tax=Marinigracilibium pacificum TaxID=2729599 RepID=A0A848IV12_9BACT|nr:hypothetical protein [Marinigracilibium pacificum]NMM47526.1 hypothetical protein [Marinigracilibium pacificum]
MKSKILLFILPILLTLGCSKEDEPLLIRIKNISQFDYKNITVNSNTFNDLNSGETSDYQTFEVAYRYAYVELEIDGEVFTIQPIDFVGETEYKNGSYTYLIDANESTERYSRLSIDLVKD